MSSGSSGSGNTQPLTRFRPPSDESFRKSQPKAIPPTWALQSISELGERAKSMFIPIIAAMSQRDFIGITPKIYTSSSGQRSA
jgi:hypothetical protein